LADDAPLPEFPAPEASRRVLVLAPHCDDETLGVGAFIADARRRGVPVTVAFLTNGDGFPVAAGRDLRDVSLTGAEMVRFAEKRQAEALRAMMALGVAPDNVVFLGYPDRGLKAMWETHWEPSTPFRSPFTKCSHSPYPRTFTPNTPYSGSALLADLERLIRKVRPTDVFVTHPADDHPDHYSAAAFTQAALQTTPDNAIRLHYYIVHRGDWPLPQGAHPDKPLVPPPGLTDRDTHWRSYAPSPEAREAKKRALSAYASQLAVMGRFLRSFLRENEIFGSLDVAHVSRHKMATALDGRQDDLARYLDPAADVSAISVARTEDGAALRVLVTLRGPVSNRVRYNLLVRGNTPPRFGGIASDDSSAVWLPLAVKAPGARVLQATIPLASLGTKTPRCVWIAAETRWRGTGRLKDLPPVDRFGYRPFLLDATDETPPKETMIR
jgi:Uncharacterized proteins, LmbE homologs